MLKYGLALLFAAGLVWLGSYFWPVLFGGYVVYLVALALALLCVKLTRRLGWNNWVLAGVLLVAGALFARFGQDYAAYVIAAGFGVLAGVLALLFVGSRNAAPAHP